MTQILSLHNKQRSVGFPNFSSPKNTKKYKPKYFQLSFWPNFLQCLTFILLSNSPCSRAKFENEKKNWVSKTKEEVLQAEGVQG
jgi:hypothetical protein